MNKAENKNNTKCITKTVKEKVKKKSLNNQTTDLIASYYVLGEFVGVSRASELALLPHEACKLVVHDCDDPEYSVDAVVADDLELSELKSESLAAFTGETRKFNNKNSVKIIISLINRKMIAI